MIDLDDDVNIDDNVDMRWCSCWCWWKHWDEMMLTLARTLIWDDVDVHDVIVMMYVVYVHGGAVTMMDIPGRRR